MASMSRQHVRCCIVGGGPAGMVLGVILARAGVAVTVLEKHGDFLRDFRGDTVHPSTLTIVDELGLREAFDALPQQRVNHLEATISSVQQQMIDFRGLKPYDYLALVPQWDFLDMLAEAGGKYAHFDLRMRHQATGLVRDGGRTCGVHVESPDGAYTLRADLVIACDGRHSSLRDAAGLQARVYGSPMDVLWFRLPRADSDSVETFGIVDRGHMMIMLNRHDYWQVAFLVPKGSDETFRNQSVDVLRQTVAQLAPFAADRTEVLTSWDQVSTLQVQVDRLPQWHQPGLLLLGDAAHAMSPIGGVGINLAVQDAVAAANMLARPLREGGAVDQALLARIQQRRELPVRVIQKVQIILQNRMISHVLEQRSGPTRLPVVLRWLLHFRVMRNLPARLFGYGLRREHVRA